MSSTTYQPVSRKSEEEFELNERQRMYESSPPSNGALSRLSLFLRQRKRAVIFVIIAVLIILGLASAEHSGVRQRIPALLAEKDGLEPILGAKTEREYGFTLVAPTYKRVERLPTFLSNYANGTIPSLRRIVLLWNDVENEPPTSFTDTLTSYTVPIIIEQRGINSLNQRFKLSENIRTNAILAIDDDIIFKPEDIELGYQTWHQYGLGRKRMVGYVPREVRDGTYVVERLPTYSMVLTKTAFFHIDWMKAYWSEDARITDVRNFVEENSNCEDILMAFIHAHYTRVPPLFVDAPSEDLGTGGISFKPGHMEARTACVRKFTEAFGEDTLVPNDMYIKRY
ncbi:MAG: hypothetical protein M1820_007856 [Bogoriella megaspora]|nr:MAG: hypothetical protein M1820_007856 [Bogoriella megaspora]